MKVALRPSECKWLYVQVSEGGFMSKSVKVDLRPSECKWLYVQVSVSGFTSK